MKSPAKTAKKKSKKDKVYGLYRGDEFIAVGKLYELSIETGVKTECLAKYLTPSRQKKLSQVPYADRLIFVEVDEDE